MIHFSKPYQLHPPPCNNATVCSSHKPRALPPPAHMWDAVLLSCPPTAGASPSRPPHPSAFPPFNLNNASVLSATLCRLFSEDKQERETDRGCRGQWNSWLDWSSSFSIAFLHLLCHAWANVRFGAKWQYLIFPLEVVSWSSVTK